MFNISFILVLFLYQMSVGCMFTLAVMPLKQVDLKFYQLSSGLSAILMALALFLSIYYPFELPKSFGVPPEGPGVWPQVALGLFLVYLGVNFILYLRMRLKKEKGAKGLVRIGALLGILALIAEGMVYRPAHLYGGFKSWVVPLDFVTAAMFLGVFLLAMVFGHWYLIKSMPKKLLRRMAEVLIVVLVARLLVVGITLGVFASQVQGGGAVLDSLMDISGGHGIFFWQRMLAGLGIPLVLSYMIWSTARIGANQSATGLLYVGLVFVIIGEIISKYMFVLSGIPI